MFEKNSLKSKIKKCKKQITALEKKRARSQSVLVEAILTSKTPADEDVSYFNMYTAQINQIRDMMHECSKKLEELEHKKP